MGFLYRSSLTVCVCHSDTTSVLKIHIHDLEGFSFFIMFRALTVQRNILLCLFLEEKKCCQGQLSTHLGSYQCLEYR